eukprot:130165-Ditylum_brightwellii.AAC.1
MVCINTVVVRINTVVAHINTVVVRINTIVDRFNTTVMDAVFLTNMLMPSGKIPTGRLLEA